MPYDVVNTDEARARLRQSPQLSACVAAGDRSSAGNQSARGRGHERARANFNQLRLAAPLVVEETPSFYIYRLEMGGHVQTGIAACYSIDEHDRDSIKKHEKTRPDKEDDRTRHMLALGAQTGPVFPTYRASKAVDGIVSRVVQEPALFDFSSADGVGQVWRVPRLKINRSSTRSRGSTRSTLPTVIIAPRRRRGRRSLAAKGPRARSSPGGGVSRQPDAGAALQPRRQRPTTA